MLEYLHGERNAVRTELVLSREKGKKAEYVCVSIPGVEQSIPIYKGWARPLKRKYQEIASITTVEGETKKPKHTGGKRPYIMVMQDKTDITDNLSVNASGLLFKLFCGGYVEWHTGRVIERRSKKAMTVSKMQKKFDVKNIELKAILKELSEKHVMTYNKSKRAYFIDRSIAKKGGGQNED